MIDFNNIPEVEVSSIARIVLSPEDAVTTWCDNIRNGRIHIDNISIYRIVHDHITVCYEIKESFYDIITLAPVGHRLLYVAVYGYLQIKEAILSVQAREATTDIMNNNTQESQESQEEQEEQEEQTDVPTTDISTADPTDTTEYSGTRVIREEILSGAEIEALIRELSQGGSNVAEEQTSNPESEVQEVQEAQADLSGYATIPDLEEDNVSEDLLPENPDNMYTVESTTRFQGAEWFEKIHQANFIVAGIGGIGSNFVYMLARLNPNTIYMYDPDIVEAVNMAGQFYCNSDIGKYKVDALEETIREYTDCHSVFAVKALYTEESPTTDIMICGFDNMSARRLFFLKWCSHIEHKTPKEKKECLFIDGRLNAEKCQTFCIRGDDEYAITLYKEQYLFSDSEVEDELCSYKQTTYCACMVGAYMVNLVVNHITNLCTPLIERDLPFFTEYDAKLMFLRTRI